MKYPSKDAISCLNGTSTILKLVFPRYPQILQQVPRRSCQTIQPGDDQHVTGLNVVYKTSQLLPIRLRAGNFFLEDLDAAAFSSDRNAREEDVCTELVLLCQIADFTDQKGHRGGPWRAIERGIKSPRLSTISKVNHLCGLNRMPPVNSQRCRGR